MSLLKPLLVIVVLAVAGHLFIDWLIPDTAAPAESDCEWLSIKRYGDAIDTATIDLSCLSEQHPDARLELVE